ncbi:hypothetical protein WA158_001211 [Blastocystis sp. Blastoise]
MKFSLFIFLCFFVISISSGIEGTFGNKFQWRTLEEGFAMVKSDEKPGILVIHKTWCTSSQYFGKRFARDMQIKNLAKDFVFISCLDDDEPEDPKYSPDGKYYPRIFFINPNGEVNYEINNSGYSPQHKYYYFDTKHLVDNMEIMIKSVKHYKNQWTIPVPPNSHEEDEL